MKPMTCGKSFINVRDSRLMEFISSCCLYISSTDGIVKVNTEEASNLPNSTAELPHESGFYVVEIDAFHQLHCLNYIRKALYPDRYMSHFRDAYNTEGKRTYSGHDARHYGKHF